MSGKRRSRNRKRPRGRSSKSHQANIDTSVNNYKQTTPNWPGNTEEKAIESTSPNDDQFMKGFPGLISSSPDIPIESFDAVVALKPERPAAPLSA